MFYWWPRILPYIGFSRMCCDSEGEPTDEDSRYERPVFVLFGWYRYAVVIWHGEVKESCS